MGLAAVTVRRDVAALAESGQLRRSHGAVSLPGGEDAAGPGGRDLVVGILVPTIGLYFDEIIAGARAAADAAGARLVLGVSAYRPADDRAKVDQLLASGVDGLLVTPNWRPDTAPEDSEWICDLPVPTVLVERQAPPGSPFAQLDAVGSDHGHGVLLALRHLASLGHDAVLLAARTDTWTAHQVRAGYAEAVRLLGLKALPIVDIDPPGSDLDEVVARLGGEDGARAVLVHNDQDALQLAPLLRARGLKVPDDVAVVSYDDVVAALGDPPLTAVAPPKHHVGRAALELLLGRLTEAEPSPVRHVALLPDLKIRTSCGGATG
jgi:DNA-binding LacI/PurR family transcriptional regulator